MAARATSKKKSATGTRKKAKSAKSAKKTTAKAKPARKASSAGKKATAKKTTARKSSAKKSTAKASAPKKAATSRSVPAGSGKLVHTRLLGIAKRLLGPTTSADGQSASGGISHTNPARSAMLKRLIGATA